MKNKYIDLIEQTFEFPQDEFTVKDNELYFHEVPLMDIIKQYGTPLKISYLPKISQQINRAKRMFNVAMAKVDYRGSYNYCYCTKSSHFSFVLEEALKNDINLETSSAYDIHIINALYDSGLINKDIFIVCNGFKRPQYVENIANLIKQGFTNTIPVLDNKQELDLLDIIDCPCQIGIRIGEGSITRSEPAKQQILGEKEQDGEHGGQNEQQAEAVTQDAFRLFFISLTQTHGKKNRTADSHQRGEGGEQRDDGSADPCSGQRNRTNFRNISHIDAVYNTVKHIYKLCEHERDGHPQNQRRDAVLPEIIHVFCLLSEHDVCCSFPCIWYMRFFYRREPDNGTPVQAENQQVFFLYFHQISSTIGK